MNVERGTPDYLRHLNKQKILHTIRDGNGHFSRASLSKHLNISKPTVSKIVEELMEEKWVFETEHTQGDVPSTGRKPLFLKFNKNAKYIIGIDIGGTVTEIAIMNLEGEPIKQSIMETQKHHPSTFVKAISEEVLDMIQSLQIDSNHIMSLGVGAPGVTDVQEGIVIEAPSIGWIEYPITKEFEKHLPFCVFVENDVNAAILGEQWKGAAKNQDNVVLITLGTGVGCGIIINGDLYRGANYAAGEAGYIITDLKEANRNIRSMFQGYGFLENKVGGPSIVDQFYRLLQEDEKTHAYKMEKEQWTAKRVFELAIEGDHLAKKVVDEAISHIATALLNVISILNPQSIVLGGGIAKSGKWFLPSIKTALQQHLPKQSQTEVMITELPQAALLGANAVCQRHYGLLKHTKEGFHV